MRLAGVAALLALFSALGLARADEPGDFDYYVLSLSWSPQYCASEARPNDPQCARPYAFVVHGLWPQNERGWPKDCGRGEYLSEALITKALRFMPSKSLVIHEWREHGVCSGLGAEAYFAAAERAYRAVRIPARYQALQQPMKTSVSKIEADFLADNPRLRPEMLSTQCSGRYFREIRICLSRSLEPRACVADLKDRCGNEVLLRPSRGG